MRIAGKIASALRGALRAGKKRNGKTKKYQRTRESSMHIQTPKSPREKKPGETLPCLTRRNEDKDYSERRKFSRSCFWLGESKSKNSSTAVASEPLLW